MLPDTTIQDFKTITNLIKEARAKAIRKVNSELVLLYWNVGVYIVKKIKNAEWGESVVDNLADYIKETEPEIKGFNRRGLYRMKQFYETYTGNKKIKKLLPEISWTHHRHILSKTKSIEEKEFYMYLSVKEKYSSTQLEKKIDSGYFERFILSVNQQDKFVSQVETQIYPELSKIFLDTYILDFLHLPKVHSENDLQLAIVSNLKNFILEVGSDFTFVGEKYRLQVGNKDFYIDLLFFHRELQSLVVFELKITEFKPEYISQLDFYLEALDKLYKKPHENPSVGVLLCKDKNEEIVKFALNRSLSPSLIAKYETQLFDKTLLKRKLNEFYELSSKKES